MKPPAVMLKQLAYFVGREKTLEQIQQALEDTGCLYLDFLEGVEGMGKTTLLVKLYADLKEQKEFNPIWICMTVFDPVRKGESSDPDSLGTLASSLDDYRQLLLELSSEFSDGAFNDFGNCVAGLFSLTLSDLIKHGAKADLGGVTIKTGDVHVGAFSRLADGQFKTGDVIVKVPDQQIRMAIDHLKNKLADEFVQRLNTSEKKFRCVLLIDNFHLVISDQVGRWFLSGVAAKMDNAVVVFAKTKTAAAVDMQDATMIALDNFSLQDVERYVQKRLDAKLFPPAMAAAIFEYSGGHPQAVVLGVDVCESLYKKGSRGNDLLEIFADVPPEYDAKAIKLIAKIKESIDDEDVLEALEIGWVLRRFDADILRALLMADEQNPGRETKYQDIISRLEEYSFTENHEEFYKFHDFIRQGMEDLLKKNDPKRYSEIHRRAAVYYGEKLIEYDKERKDESSYLRWYRYESYEWQTLIAEWLYHLKYAPQRDRARFMFLKVYVDAFWWWGAYEAFPFCERLLGEWRRTQMSDEDKGWFRFVEQFHASYPTGYLKRGKGDWARVQTSLTCLRQLSGMEGPAESLDADHRHVRGLTNIFLGQAYFYQELQDPQAEKLFLEALKIFQEDDDEWNTMWTLYYLADLYMSRQDNDKAVSFCGQALELALKPPMGKRDYEMIANLRRVLADVGWQTGQRESSFLDYARAVAAAYLYHGVPSPADLYTRSLQREMMERACARLQDLWAEGKKQDAGHFAETLLKFFAPHWKLIKRQVNMDPAELGSLLEKGQTDTLTRYLFPRLPQDDELNRREVDYIDHILTLLNDLSPQVAAMGKG